jgi:AraC-like DNA-binding protein
VPTRFGRADGRSQVLGGPRGEPAVGLLPAHVLDPGHHRPAPAERVDERPESIPGEDARDPTLVRVEQLPELVGWSLRTLQRHFRPTVGVSAKWVLARFHLQAAAVELERDPG